jgi:hypothetical protein
VAGRSIIFRIRYLLLRSIHLDVLVATGKKRFVIFRLPKWPFGPKNALGGIDISSHLAAQSTQF